MALDSTVAAVTDRIIARSERTRRTCLDTMARAAAEGPRRGEGRSREAHHRQP